MVSWRRVLAALGLIAFLAAAAYGLRADLPHTRFATEEEQVFYAVKFGSGDLNPHYFLHPPLFAYVLFGLYGLAFLAGRAMGAFHSVGDYERLFFENPTLFFVLARLLVLALSAAGLFLCYRLARRLYRRDDVAWLATALLASSTLYVVAAHYANTDIPMMVLALLALIQLTLVVQEGRPGAYLLGGLLIGLATATKYNAAWLGGGLVLAHLVHGRSAGQSWAAMARPGWLWAGLALLAVGFVAGCPYALLDWRTFLASFQKLRWELMTPEYHFASYRAQGQGHWFILTSVLPSMVGWPLAAACLAGVGYALRRRAPEDWWLTLFIASFVLYLGLWDIIKPRYFIYLLPLLVILAARWLADMAARFRPGPVRGLAAAAALGALLAPAWGQNIAFNRLVARPRAAAMARSWIEAHVPSGTAIATFAGVPITPNAASIDRQLAETRDKGIGQGVRLQRLRRHVEALPAAYDVWHLPFPWREDFDVSDFDFARHRAAGVEYVVVTHEIQQYLADPPRYPAQVAYYEAVKREGRLVQEFHQQAPEVDPGLGPVEFVQIYRVGEDQAVGRGPEARGAEHDNG